jgi:uncharacterized protein YecT (DUF1311 family)
MQLLGVSKTKVSLIGLIFFSLTRLAIADSTCDGSITRELEACAKNNFYLSDRNLNTEYLTAMSKMQGKDKDNLRDAQRLWIRYKVAYCQNAFDAVSPGEEAGIDKWACLDRTTNVRFRELQYIDSKIDMRSFFQSITSIANIYEGGDLGKVIKKLKNLPSATVDQSWMSYVEANCKITYSTLLEENDVCIARQNFFKEW